MRPAPPRIDNMEVVKGDTTNLKRGNLGQADSVSCVHPLVRVGPGRYRDIVYPDGFLSALDILVSLVEPEGGLSWSVPKPSDQPVDFSVDRARSVPFTRPLIDSRLEQLELTTVDDQGSFHSHLPPAAPSTQDSLGTTYGGATWRSTNPNPWSS